MDRPATASRVWAFLDGGRDDDTSVGDLLTTSGNNLGDLLSVGSMPSMPPCSDGDDEKDIGPGNVGDHIGPVQTAERSPQTADTQDSSAFQWETAPDRSEVVLTSADAPCVDLEVDHVL